MYVITAPNEKYNGVSASVPFVNGVGETQSEHLAQWFKDKGYNVEQKEEQKEHKEKPVAKMNKAELTALLLEKGIAVPDNATNEVLINLLKSTAE